MTGRGSDLSPWLGAYVPVAANLDDDLMSMPEFKAYVDAVEALDEASKTGAGIKDEVMAVLATGPGLARIAYQRPSP